MTALKTIRLLPRPPIAWPWCEPPPLTRLRPPLGIALPALAPKPFATLFELFDDAGWVDVSGRGKGEGRSSTEREWGLRKGPVVIGRFDERLPLAFADAEKLVLLRGCTPPEGPECGVGGGEVPILLPSFRVGGREWMSSIASARGFECVRRNGVRKLTSDSAVALLLFAGSSPALLDAFQ